jgi:hypothetical protein
VFAESDAAAEVLAIYFTRVGLDKADKLGSVVILGRRGVRGPVRRRGRRPAPGLRSRNRPATAEDFRCGICRIGCRTTTAGWPGSPTPPHRPRRTARFGGPPSR